MQLYLLEPPLFTQSYNIQYKHLYRIRIWIEPVLCLNLWWTRKDFVLWSHAVAHHHHQFKFVMKHVGLPFFYSMKSFTTTLYSATYNTTFYLTRLIHKARWVTCHYMKSVQSILFLQIQNHPFNLQMIWVSDGYTDLDVN